MLTLMSKIIVFTVRDEFISQNNSNFPLCQKCTVYFSQKNCEYLVFQTVLKHQKKVIQNHPANQNKQPFPFCYWFFLGYILSEL